jgi:hypothetical protein
VVYHTAALLQRGIQNAATIGQEFRFVQFSHKSNIAYSNGIPRAQVRKAPAAVDDPLHHQLVSRFEEM